MKIVIAGGRGLVGSNLARRLAVRHEVRAFGHLELDITEPPAVRALLSAERPDWLINCAMFGVDESERDPSRAQVVNGVAPGALAEAAREVGARMLHFGTSYVFDGRRPPGEHYGPDDATGPINVYGWSKLAGEQAVRARHPEALIVRTSWVYGPFSGNFLSSLPRLLRGGERIRAIEDLWASTTYALDLADRVETLLEIAPPGTYHVVNEGPCTYLEFVRELARILRLEPAVIARQVEVVREVDMARAAPRPRNTALACPAQATLGLEPLRPWTEALADYVRDDADASS